MEQAKRRFSNNNNEDNTIDNNNLESIPDFNNPKKQKTEPVSKADHTKKNQEFSQKLQQYRIKLTKEGFVPAFDINANKDEWMSFWNKYGFVCVKNAVTPKHCRDAVTAVYDFFEQSGTGIKRGDWKTWKNAAMPDGVGLGMIGGYILPNENPRTTRRVDLLCHSQQAWDNRASPTLHKAFGTILGTDDLLCSIDRFAFMRPVKSKPKDLKENWSTKKKWLHWDQHPLNEPHFVRVQGVLALEDTREEDGGLQLVPGTQQIFEEWGKLHESSLKERKGDLVDVPEGDLLWNFLQKIPMKAGTICIWDSRLAHSNYPNSSNHPRIAQYITMFPNNFSQNPEYRDIRLEAFRERLRISHRNAAGHAFSAGRWAKLPAIPASRPENKPNVKLSPLGQMLLGEITFEQFKTRNKDENSEDDNDNNNNNNNNNNCNNNQNNNNSNSNNDNRNNNVGNQ